MNQARLIGVEQIVSSYVIFLNFNLLKHTKTYKPRKRGINMEKNIGKINKNENTDIVVRIDDFGGKTGLTIREFTTSERYTGFTKSGTRIPVEKFPEFKELINSINPDDLKTAAPAAQEAQETLAKAEAGKPNTKDVNEVVDY